MAVTIKQGEDKLVVLPILEGEAAVNVVGATEIVAVAYVGGVPVQTYALVDAAAGNLALGVAINEINIYVEREHSRHWPTGTLTFNVLITRPGAGFQDSLVVTEHTVSLAVGTITTGLLRNFGVAGEVNMNEPTVTVNGPSFKVYEAGDGDRTLHSWTLTKPPSLSFIGTPPRISLVAIQKSYNNITWTDWRGIAFNQNDSQVIRFPLVNLTIGSSARSQLPVTVFPSEIIPSASVRYDENEIKVFRPVIKYRLRVVCGGETFYMGGASQVITIETAFRSLPCWMHTNDFGLAYFQTYIFNNGTDFRFPYETTGIRVIRDFTSKLFTTAGVPALYVNGACHLYFQFPSNFANKTIFRFNDANGANIPMEPAVIRHDTGADRHHPISIPESGWVEYKCYKSVSTYFGPNTFYVAN